MNDTIGKRLSDASNKQSLKKILSHPLLLLLMGALFTSLLFPYITRQWQITEKEIELKSELIDEINEAISNTMTYYRLSTSSELRNASTSARLDSFVQWQISANKIGSKLDLYFPSNSQLRSDWDDLHKAVSAMGTFVASTTSSDPPSRASDRSMCNRLGRTVEAHAVYSTRPINIDPDVVEYFRCDRWEVEALQNSSHLKEIFPLKDGKTDWNVTANDDDINWNSLFLRTYATLPESMGRLEAGYEWSNNYNLVEARIYEDKNRLLSDVITSHIRAFQ